MAAPAVETSAGALEDGEGSVGAPVEEGVAEPVTDSDGVADGVGSPGTGAPVDDSAGGTPELDGAGVSAGVDAGGAGGASLDGVAGGEGPGTTGSWDDDTTGGGWYGTLEDGSGVGPIGAHSLTVLVMVTVTWAGPGMQVSWRCAGPVTEDSHSCSVATTAQASAATAKSLKANMLMSLTD